MVFKNQAVVAYIFSNLVRVLLKNTEQRRDENDPLLSMLFGMCQGITQSRQGLARSGRNIQAIYPTGLFGGLAALVGDGAPSLVDRGGQGELVQLFLHPVQTLSPQFLQHLGVSMFGKLHVVHEFGGISPISFYNCREQQPGKQTAVKSGLLLVALIVSLLAGHGEDVFQYRGQLLLGSLKIPVQLLRTCAEAIKIFHCFLIADAFLGQPVLEATLATAGHNIE